MDRRAFLQAIREAPEDDAPRLIYADWLEEHGQGDADRDRAEFIRVQCELARLRHGSPELTDRYAALGHRDSELWERHGKAWVAELGLPRNRHTRCRPRRGLVASVECTLRYFVEHGDAVLDAAPIEAVFFRRATARNITDLRRCPAFGRLRGVELPMPETPAAAVARFLEAVPVRHLGTLGLITESIELSPGWETRNNALAVALASCPGLAGLRRLRLRFAGVGDEGGRALARSPHLAGLEFLDLYGNTFSPPVEAGLRERFGRRLCLGPADLHHFTLGEVGQD